MVGGGGGEVGGFSTGAAAGFAFLLMTRDLVFGCSCCLGWILTVILAFLALRACSSSSIESRGRFLRPMLDCWRRLWTMLWLLGDIATLLLVLDRVESPSDRLEVRVKVDAIGMLEIVEHVASLQRASRLRRGQSCSSDQGLPGRVGLVS